MVKKADYVLIAVLLAFSCIFYFALAFGRTGGQYAEIRFNTELVAVLPLSDDIEYELRSNSGTLLNIIKIAGGKLSVKYANCPDKDCEKQGEISKARETIVCLPNFVVIEIAAGGQGEYDAIVK